MSSVKFNKTNHVCCMKYFKSIRRIFFAAIIFFVNAGADYAQTNAHEIPVLCYHQIRELHSGDSKLFITSPEQFGIQMKALADSGYHIILPDQLLAYLN